MTWRREQGQDRFFRRAKAEGYRARSAYKLLEICEKHGVLRPGQAVLDLGAAPGSWTQVAVQQVGGAGRVVSVDLQPIFEILGAQTIVGDIRDSAVVDQAISSLGQPADVVLSDVAPQASGILVVDQARAIELATTALEAATRALRPNGSFVVKVFRGEEFDAFLLKVRGQFKKVNVVIPEATREESREAFVVARGFGTPEAKSARPRGAFGAVARKPRTASKGTRRH
jgi:23S rRNA (uridine2552-2'-O)-methyltransferase